MRARYYLVGAGIVVLFGLLMGLFFFVKGLPSLVVSQPSYEWAGLLVGLISLVGVMVAAIAEIIKPKSRRSNVKFAAGLTVALLVLSIISILIFVYPQLKLRTAAQISELPDGSDVWIKGQVTTLSTSYRWATPSQENNDFAPIGISDGQGGIAIVYKTGVNIASLFTDEVVVVHGVKMGWDGAHLNNWNVFGVPSQSCVINMLEIRKPNIGE